ncbi:GtrA-like protein [Variibacter gotjawalensis]|uniref:GtrA-like protein n=1 Tax=Variibacter gotjawalensis TaxID=1333996 RepID=A0A0S3PZ40_9BRAD|nr:GtrA family protein [Variibacter gotjawalensis]NIK46992.1 putative flippase GtrA [Variibacter gotjawalensis]RZS48896.1 putative flippase GtrA [Variibacter gotjawalensis]BAT61155.1 GtrA-like protein [Variibacter gotjawalensis]
MSSRHADVVWLKQIRAYGLVGLVNTVIGFCVTATFEMLGLSPVLANACGFAVGLTFSFMLNGKYTFDHAEWRSALTPFLIAFGFCYALNLAVLLATSKLAAIHFLLPQLLAVATYNVSFFLLMKFTVYISRS